MSAENIKLTPVVVGVDVGGTNTDAVVIRKSGNVPDVIATVKKLTTADVTSGVRNAVYAALTQASEREPITVNQVNIGTTHFVNAAVQGRGLVKVSVIRLCGTTSRSLPPFSDFPAQLRDTIFGSVHLCDGGYRFDGTEIDPINKKEISNVVAEIRKNKIKNVIISGVFSPVRTEQEETVKKMVLDLYPEVSISLSHEIGYLGLLERENAAILNECLKPLCKKTVEGFEEALAGIGIVSPIFLTQNDGTIISSVDAMQIPVRTFASGPTNSMRGAAFLSSVTDAIVLDIGGTTTDVGVIKNRFPREASTQVRIAGVRTNFRMPDVISYGLGGGSYVTPLEDAQGNVTSVSVGPLSAGYNLMNEALAFGEGVNDPGRRLTTSDIAIAEGHLNLGKRENVAHLSKSLKEKTKQTIVSMIEEAIDKVKVSGEIVPVILVGGGSVLVGKDLKIAGASNVIIPKYSGVANAIGAGLSQVSGSVDYVACLQDMVDPEQLKMAETEALAQYEDKVGIEATHAAENARRPFYVAARDAAMAAAVDKAKSLVLAAGGDPASVEITEKEDMTLSYIPGQATRFKIKAVSDLKATGGECSDKKWTAQKVTKFPEEKQRTIFEKQQTTSTGQKLSDEVAVDDATKHPKKPYINQNDEWILSEWDIEAIVIGAGIFGCGGGGNPHIGRLRALAAVRNGKKIRVVLPEKFYENADPKSDLTAVVAFMGAPLIMFEQLVSSVETTGALTCLQEVYQIGGFEDEVLQNVENIAVQQKHDIKYVEDLKFAKKTNNIVALMTGEIGGMNAIEPLLVSADLGMPVIDSDGMGRAFPELQMFAPYMYGLSASPAALVDDKGTRAVMLKSPTPKHLENHFRETVIRMGCSAGLALSPLNKHEVMAHTVLYSVSHAWRVGDAVLRSRLDKKSPIRAILEIERSKHILNGKIRDVKRNTTGGFNRGSILIEGVDEFFGNKIQVEFQNENLVIFPLDESKKPGKEIASVPDLITIVDADTAEPIPTEEVKYGMRVAVLVLAAPDLLKTEQALKYVGPKAFHYDDVTYVPIGDAYPIDPVLSQYANL